MADHMTWIRCIGIHPVVRTIPSMLICTKLSPLVALPDERRLAAPMHKVCIYLAKFTHKTLVIVWISFVKKKRKIHS